MEQLSCSGDFRGARSEVQKIIQRSAPKDKETWGNFLGRIDQVLTGKADPVILGYPCFSANKQREIDRWERSLQEHERSLKLKSLGINEGYSVQVFGVNIPDDDGAVKVVGRIRNNGTQPIRSLSLSYELYDSQRRIIHTGIVYTNPTQLNGGEYGSFQIFLVKNTHRIIITSWEGHGEKFIKVGGRF